MTAPISNQNTPDVNSTAPVQGPKDGKAESLKPDIFAICAILLQETCNTRAQDLNQDQKDIAAKGASMQSLNDRLRAMDHWKLVVTTIKEWTTYKTHDKPDLIHRWGYTSYHKHYQSLNKLTAANCRMEMKQRDAERSQISAAFGEEQNALQTPETDITVTTNGIQQAEQQGLNLLIQLQQLTYKAMGQRQPS